MADTYILIDVSGRALMLSEEEIQREAAERMASGEVFQIYRAEPMQLQISLTPAQGRQAPMAAAPARPAKKAKKAAPKRRAKAAKKAKPAKAAAAEGKVGRPRVNVGPCTVPGCKRPQKTRGLCSAHYQQHRRNVRMGKPGLMQEGAEEATAAAPAKKAAKKAPAKKAAKKRASKKAAPRKSAPKKAAKKAPAKKAAKKRGSKKTASKKAATRSPATEKTGTETQPAAQA